MPNDTHPVGHAVAAERAIKDAASLLHARLKLQELSLIPQTHLAQAVNEQRQAVFTLALRLIDSECNKLMDSACEHWATYRKSTTP